MNKIKYLTLFIFLFIPFLASAQITEEDYFHATADLYIKGNKREAKKKLREAAERFPDSEKIKKLSSAVDKLPDEEDPPPPPPPPPPPERSQPQMSKENAQQILDALMQDEKETQEKLKREMPKGKREAEKDW